MTNNMFIWICFDVRVMSKTRLCRYECGTELGDFDEKQNKYLELSGTLHTRERCESLKNRTGTKKVESTGNFADMNGQPTMYTLYEKIQKILAELTDIDQYVKERLK
jgi:hypothetical protein